MPCSICIGMVIGWLCSRLLKAPKKLRPHIICCIATGMLVCSLLAQAIADWRSDSPE